MIASGEDFPDGLAASTFYKPVLLTQAAALPAATQAEINRLIGTSTSPGVCSNGLTGTAFAPILDTTVVGGPAVISSTQKEVLDTYGTSTRVSGANRYATAIAVAKAATPGTTSAIIATGQDFPDALAGGVLAQQTGAPILLNDGATVRPEVSSYLLAEGITQVTILGGTTAVPASVEAELKGALGITTVSRLAGANRWATAVAVANAINPGSTPTVPLWPGGSGVTVVNGFGFADALAAAPLAFLGSNGPSPILLTAATMVPAETAVYHSTWCNDIAFIDAIGGTTVISAAVVIVAVGAATCSAPAITKATLLNNDFKQAVFTINAGLTVTAKAGTAADGAAANAWQVALIQNGLPGTEKVVVDPEGNDNAAYGGIPTFIMTANFPALTNQGFVNVWNGSPAFALTTAATTDGTATTGLPSSASPGTVVALNTLATTLGSQDSTVVVTFDRNVSVATTSGLYPNLNPASAALTLGALVQTPLAGDMVNAANPTGRSTVTYKWSDSTAGIPMLPNAQIRFAAGSVVDGASGTPSSVIVAKTLVAP